MSNSSGDEPSLSDAELEAFLKDAAEGSSGGGAPPPEEPSARARMVARRLREEEEAARRGKKGRQADPPGWRTGPAWDEVNGRRTRRRRVLAVAGVVLAAAVAVVAVRPSLLLDRFGDTGTTEAKSPDSGLPTREQPFRGSPALSWADGAEGIELPKAKAVGGMSKADVASALRMTKELLVASHLDPDVLGGGRPEKAIGLLDPKSPGLTDQVERSLSDPSREDDPLTLFTRFDPDEARVIGGAVKVRGEMTYEAGDPGSVEVHADYTFVYAVERVGGDEAVDRTIVRRDVTMMLADPERWEATEGRLLPKSYYADFGNTACEVYDGYLHPSFSGASATGSPATGPEIDPYDRSEPLTGERDMACGKVTRT
ncbi:hypothetical protein SUDANB145_03062 [Streptomyces sp. enrichment culture]|uniref:hypothetical protein n=1 Tax=Streptomyces sp. enrichment culture TaxID=1795815 RepID=UPI003F56B15A